MLNACSVTMWQARLEKSGLWPLHCLFCEIYSADKRTKEPWPFVILLLATENLGKKKIG